MTGEKNKFTTHEKLWKLDDELLSTPKHDEMVIYLLNKDNLPKIIKDINFNRNLKISSEVPILGNNRFIIGYWDVQIDFEDMPSVDKSYFMHYLSTGRRNNTILSMVNPVNLPIYIEIKPKIKSFGETLRQLKTYQAYAPDSIGRTYLFTSDIGFKGAFESQGIKVIEYDKL